MLESFLFNQAAVFVLILSRIGGLIATAPPFAGQSTPLRVRGMLAVALSVLILPTHSDLSFEFTEGRNLVSFAMLVALEIIVGLLIGLGMMILLLGVQACLLYTSPSPRDS